MIYIQPCTDYQPVLSLSLKPCCLRTRGSASFPRAGMPGSSRKDQASETEQAENARCSLSAYPISEVYKRGNASFPQAERRAGSLGLREGRPKDQRPDRSRTVRPKPQRQDRLTGSTCLYMNYSIILPKLVSIDKLQFCYK